MGNSRAGVKERIAKINREENYQNEQYPELPPLMSTLYNQGLFALRMAAFGKIVKSLDVSNSIEEGYSKPMELMMHLAVLHFEIAVPEMTAEDIQRIIEAKIFPEFEKKLDGNEDEVMSLALMIPIYGTWYSKVAKLSDEGELLKVKRLSVNENDQRAKITLG